jgi:hypothetical protein
MLLAAKSHWTLTVCDAAVSTAVLTEMAKDRGRLLLAKWHAAAPTLVPSTVTRTAAMPALVLAFANEKAPAAWMTNELAPVVRVNDRRSTNVWLVVEASAARAVEAVCTRPPVAGGE